MVMNFQIKITVMQQNIDGDVMQDNKYNFYGEWNITKVSAYAPVSQNDEEFFEKIVGKKWC